MVSIRIGSDERTLDRLDAQWVHEHINNRRVEGERPCIRVAIEIPDAHFELVTPECGGGSGGRPLSSLETRILELWRKHRLNSSDYNSGQLIAFLNDMRQFG